MNNPLLAAALGYAERGWQVFPLYEPADGGGCSCGKPKCDRVGKHPRTAHGLKDATTDAAVIRDWWATWPGANVGIVTGPASGFWVVGPDGAEGLADLGQLIHEHGPIPPTMRTRSGSGGEHWFYCWPSDGKPIPNRRNHRGLKIDVRACGDGPGYIVAPPSRNANGAYRWLDEREPVEAPPWLLNWVRGVVLKVPPSKPRPSAVERAIAYVAKCPPAVSGQGGHDQLFRVARAVVWGFDLDAATALDVLAKHYNPRCQPEWSETELAHKVQEAATKDFGKPRGYLNRDSPRGENPRANSGDSGDANPSLGLWRPPSPLPESPPVPPFPIDVFPAKVADYWTAAARSLAVLVDYVAVPGLALLGSAVGRSRAIGVKRGYLEVASLWTVVIAPPGATKSASLKYARAPLALAEARWMADHRTAMTAFDAEMDRYGELVKAWKKGGCEGEPPAKPRRPTLRQATLDNMTTEAAGKVLNDCPRGVCIVKDELSGFVRSMNQYRPGGKGDDKQFWLSAWAGATAKKNRSTDHDAGPLVVLHPFVGIAGMMTPSSLPELRGDNRHGEGADDGFVDRFLFSFPDPIDASGETWDEVSDVLKEGYCEVVLDLLRLEMVAESDGPDRETLRPYIVPLSPEARKVWEQFTQAIAKAMNSLERFDPFRGVLAKLRGYGARLAILLWCLRRICGELEPGDPIDGETLHKAARLIDYFEAHGRRCLGVGWADRKHRVAKRLVSWLAKKPDKTAFTRTEAFQQLKDRRDVTSTDSLADVFRVLTDHGFIRPADPFGNGRPGPAPEVYAVNPLWVRSA